MAEIGLFYFDADTSFPGVIVSDLTGGRVLVRVWTDVGDRSEVAMLSATPGAMVFIKNA